MLPGGAIGLALRGSHRLFSAAHPVFPGSRFLAPRNPSDNLTSSGLAWLHNYSFKPNLLRYINNMADRACHVVASTTQVGLIQVLAAMKASEVLEILKDAVSTAQEAGVAHVAIEDLAAFTADLERTAAESPEDVSAGDASMEMYKAKLAALGNSLQQEHASNLEMLRATITTGQSALKSALLINGGAAAATLAFIGSVWGNTKTSALLPNLAYGLSLFVWGVLSAACAAGATYLSQAGYGGEFGSRSQLIGRIGLALAVAGVVGAYVFFGVAAWQTYVAVSG